MAPKQKYALYLMLLLLLVLALRLAISFQVPYPSYESYFTIMQAESITETGLPRYHDDFSYQGRDYALNPLFYYLMAFFTLLMPATFAMKLLPNLFLVALIPLTYLIAHRLTATRWVSLAAAFFAGFSPLLFSSYLNNAVAMSLALPLSVALLLALLNLEERPKSALLLTVLLTLISPLIWLFIAAYLIYLLILMAERIEINTPYLELALFTFLLAFWYNLIIYKQAFSRHGFTILTHYLPESVRQASFAEFTLLAMIYAVGVVPIALGALAIYTNTFEVRSRRTLIIISFGLVTLFAAILQLLPLQLTLLLLSLTFIILAAPGLHSISTFLRRTRFEWMHHWIVGALLLLFILSSLLPAIATGIYPRSSPLPAEFRALTWLRENTDASSVILATPATGFLLNRVAGRSYVADEQYLLITNPDEILADIDNAYTARSAVTAAEILTEYGVTHIYLGPKENERYKRLSAIASDRTCFPLLHQGTQVLIFGVECGVEVS